MRKVSEHGYLVALGVATLGLATITTVSYLDWRQYVTNEALQDRIEASIDSTNELISRVAVAESSARGYVLTGNEQDLQPYLESLPKIERLVISDSNLGLVDPQFPERLQRDVRRKLEIIAKTIETRRNEGFEQAAAIFATNRGRQSKDEVWLHGEQLIGELRAATGKLERLSNLRVERSRLFIVNGSLLLAGLLALAAVYVRRLVSSLQAAEQRYRLLFENNPQPMWVYDRQTLAFLAVNQAAIVKYGYDEAQFRRMTLKDIRPKEDIPALLAATGGRSPHFHSEGPWRHAKRDGSLIVVEIAEHPIAFDGRDACLAMPRDITVEREAIDALTESQERLQFALDAANEGLWDWTVPTGEGYFGPRYYAILGYEPEELPTGHESWRTLVHPDDLERITNQRAEQIQLTGGFRTEYRMRKKTGEYIWIQSHGRVVSHTESGAPKRIVGTITDISDRKALEEQFRQAQRLESVGRLAGGIAHDFNNLLTVINGYASMLLSDRDLRGQGRDRVAEISSAGERAADLTQQLLAFSRKQILQMETINLNHVVIDAERMIGRLIGEHITLTTRLSPKLDHVLCDAGQIHQILVNLAVNSRDAMPNGGTLLIETANVAIGEEYVVKYPEMRPGAFVLLAVSDSGVGMTPQVREHIFEPFFTTKPQGAGTGLGLSTVYGIVKQSNGWIWVYSEPGQGTTFKIYLPRVEKAPSRTSAMAKTDVRGQETILVVEDQAEVRGLVVRALQQLGYTIHESTGPEEALRFAGNFPDKVDLLLTDVVMPGMTGPDLAIRLRTIWPNLPVLLMSGYTDQPIARSHSIDNDTPFLQKPFTPGALAEKVREVLGPGAGAASTVLVVDDDAAVRVFLRKHLTSAGYAVLEAGNGRQAYEQLEGAQEIDVVITDLILPERGGLEAIQRLTVAFPKLKIIAISGAFDGNLRSVATAVGADAALTKPVNPDDLLNTVRSLLGPKLTGC